MSFYFHEVLQHLNTFILEIRKSQDLAKDFGGMASI